MKYIIYLILSPIVLLLIGLLIIWQLPANYLADQAETGCNSQCRLTDTSGSVWHGKGNLFIKENQHSKWLNIGQLTWNTKFNQILNQKILLDLLLDNGKADIIITPKAVEAKISQLRIPAAMFLGRLGDGMPISGWGGWFILQDVVSKMSFDNKESSHNLNIFWKQAKAQIFQDGVMGDYQIQGTVKNGNGTLNLTTITGDLQLNGIATMAGNFRFNGQARAEPNTSLEAALRRVSQNQNPDGSFNIRFPN